MQRIGHRVNLLNTEDEDGYTALHLSCLNRDVNFVRWLVDAGVDIETKSRKERWTALHCACRTGVREIILFLLNSYANPFVSDRNGKLPIDLADDAELQEVIDIHMSVDARKHSFTEDNEGNDHVEYDVTDLHETVLKHCSGIGCDHTEFCEVTKL